MDKTILFGNGVNRVLSGGLTWSSMLQDIAYDNDIECSDLINSNQYTMVYEQIVANKKISEIDLKQSIAKKIVTSTYSESYKHLSNTNVRNYLTTNYEHYLEQEFLTRFSLKDKEESETIYSVRRNVEFKGDQPATIWNIHGSIREPKSIMLGLDHYCGYIGKIDSYIKGHYTYEQGKEKIKVSSIEDKLKEENATFDRKSWIELLFNSNIFILGLGLEFVETDLWWILNKRARMKKSSRTKGLIQNKIVYYGEENHARKNLLEAFDIEVVTMKYNGSNKYDEFFIDTIDDINMR